MYCRLKDEYKLRGWKLLPTGVVDSRTGRYTFLEPEVYRTLKLCNGAFDEDSFIFSGKDRENIRDLAEKGVIELLTEQKPLKPSQLYKEYDNRFLSQVHWSITGKCNARCKHCYMSAPHAMMGEFSHDTCMDIIRQMGECGVVKVTISGGEPLIRRDFLEIIDAILENGIAITTIMSNGLLVNDELLDEMDKRNIKPEFNMSFDGIGWHDWLRGVKGAEEKVIHAFRICHERGFPTGAEYCLHKGNMGVMRESIKLLGSLGLNNLKINRLNLQGEGVNLNDFALSLNEAFDFYLDYIPQYIEDNAPMPILLAGFFMAHNTTEYGIPYAKLSEDISADDYCLCGHVRNVMHITADGRIVPCIPMGNADGGRENFPLLEEMKIRDALTDSYYMNFISAQLKEYFARNPECANCEYRNRCAGGCRGIAVIASEENDLWAKDPEACTFFKDGYYEKLTSLAQKLGLTLYDAKETQRRIDNIKSFLNELQNNSSLQEKINEALNTHEDRSVEAIIIPIAREAGYYFTPEEFIAYNKAEWKKPPEILQKIL